MAKNVCWKHGKSFQDGLMWPFILEKEIKTLLAIKKNLPLGQESVKVEDTLITASQSWELFDKDLQWNPWKRQCHCG